MNNTNNTTTEKSGLYDIVTLSSCHHPRALFAKAMEWRCQSYGMRRSKLCFKRVKAMEWRGQRWSLTKIRNKR